MFTLYIHIIDCKHERWKCVICFPLVCFFLPSFLAEYKQNQSCFELLLLILWTALYCSQLTWYKLRLLTELLVRPDGEIFNWVKDSPSWPRAKYSLSLADLTQSITMLSFDRCVPIFFRWRKPVSVNTFFWQGWMCFPGLTYLMTCMSLIQDFFSCGLSMKLYSRPYRSYNNKILFLPLFRPFTSAVWIDTWLFPVGVHFHEAWSAVMEVTMTFIAKEY